MTDDAEKGDELALTPEKGDGVEEEIGARVDLAVTIAVDVVLVIATAGFLRFEAWAVKQLGMSNSVPVSVIDFILEWGAILNTARIVVQDQVRAWKRT